MHGDALGIVQAGRQRALEQLTGGRELNRMSEAPGMQNLSGSDSTSAARRSLGKPKPMVCSSRENATHTIGPTLNFTRPWIRCSSVLGSESATRRTSAIVTMSMSCTTFSAWQQLGSR